MKFFHRIWIDERGFPTELYGTIARIKPDCRQKDHFCLESQPGDEENADLIKSLVDLCKRHSVPLTKAGEPGTYDYTIVRHYEADDLKSAPFLMLRTQKRMFRERLKRDDAGRLVLPAAQSGVSIKIASGMFNHVYVVSDSAKKVLEAGQMTGVFFRETVLQGTSIRATTETLWEIDTNIKLPKMVNSFLNSHSVVPCYYIAEPPYRNAEPHYRPQDLLPLGDFDIARSFEQLGSEPGVIVSQKFYQHCLKNKILLEAQPVRIDPV